MCCVTGGTVNTGDAHENQVDKAEKEDAKTPNKPKADKAEKEDAKTPNKPKADKPKKDHAQAPNESKPCSES